MASRTEGARPMLQPIQFPVKAPTGAAAAGTKVVLVEDAKSILDGKADRDLAKVVSSLSTYGTEISLENLNKLLLRAGYSAVALDEAALGATGTAAASAARSAE